MGTATMSSVKRKAPETLLQRRVRPRWEPSEKLEETNEETLAESSAENDDEGVRDAAEENDSSEEPESDEPEEEITDNVASISFGALAKAQASLEPGRKKRVANKVGDTWEDNEALERKAGRKDHRDFNRSSKHAPTEISSKKAVSRKREVVPVVKRAYRDPRFEAVGGPIDETKVSKAYAFLDDYREDEMKELRNAIKNTKDEDAKEKLKRALLSMESKKKAQLRKNKEQEILDRHRKEEKESSPSISRKRSRRSVSCLILSGISRGNNSIVSSSGEGRRWRARRRKRCRMHEELWSRLTFPRHNHIAAFPRGRHFHTLNILFQLCILANVQGGDDLFCIYLQKIGLLHAVFKQFSTPYTAPPC